MGNFACGSLVPHQSNPGTKSKDLGFKKMNHRLVSTACSHYAQIKKSVKIRVIRGKIPDHRFVCTACPHCAQIKKSVKIRVIRGKIPDHRFVCTARPHYAQIYTDQEQKIRENPCNPWLQIRGFAVAVCPVIGEHRDGQRRDVGLARRPHGYDSVSPGAMC
jgi:hypothetical protein